MQPGSECKESKYSEPALSGSPISIFGNQTTSFCVQMLIRKGLSRNSTLKVIHLKHRNLNAPLIVLLEHFNMQIARVILKQYTTRQG